MTTKSTAVATSDDTRRPLTEIVREGANLAEDDWRESRIAAARALLPAEFRDDIPTMIAFLARAQRSGLDPFLGELYAWKGEHGKIQFMTARDGWLKLARDDDRIAKVVYGHVHEGDEYTKERDEETGAWTITHRGGFTAAADVIGAYCNVVMADGSSHLEERTYADYNHLLGKGNWKQDPKGMLLTRVASAAIKMSCPRAAGLYSDAHEGDFEGLAGAGVAGYVVQQATQRRTEDLRDRLAASQGPTDAEFELTDGSAEQDRTPAEVAENLIAKADESLDELAVPCPYCEQRFNDNRGRGGHISIHRDERSLEADMVKVGFRIERRDLVPRTYRADQVTFVGFLDDVEDPTTEAATWMACYDLLTSEPEVEDVAPAIGATEAFADLPDGYRIFPGAQPGTFDLLHHDDGVLFEGLESADVAIAKAHWHADPPQDAAPEADISIVQLYQRAESLGFGPKDVDEMIQQDPYTQFRESGSGQTSLFNLDTGHRHRLLAQMEVIAEERA